MHMRYAGEKKKKWKGEYMKDNKKAIFLLDNPGICGQMGKNAKKRIIAKEWTWEGYAQRVIRIYESLI